MYIRFIESLGAKVYNTPPSIEKLSDIFQEFYLKAESHIATHISALSTRQARGGSPNPSISSNSSISTREAKPIRSSTSKDTLYSPSGAAPEQQMLTALEISDRRKARRMLDRKGTALEEAMERRVCQPVYKRIWRHRTTLDEVRDEKLRSRTAALALVGIGLKDLGVNFHTTLSTTDNGAIEQDPLVVEWVAKAREGLLRMNDAKYPLGKLQQLAAAHKAIVDLLTALKQSSSSADEILPTLIYTLITTPPEGINVISNLNFIQRFRAGTKVDGEAAYCLTNLEAAITFLETVDLASLRSDEPLEGPPKSTSRPTTPHSESSRECLLQTPTSAPTSSSSAAVTSGTDTPQSPLVEHPLLSPSLTKPAGPDSPLHKRRVSNLFQPPASALGAAGDVVRNTADQGIKSIGNTLDSSFKLLFGRLKEQKVVGEGTDADGTVIVPKTLDDARRLVEPKPADDGEDNAVSEAGSVVEKHDDAVPSDIKLDDSILNAFAGRKQTRDRSVDSVQSSGSGKPAAFAAPNNNGRESTGSLTSSAPIQQPTSHPANAAVESMRSIGNSLNPLKGFGAINPLRGFSRSSPSGTLNSIPALGSTVSAEQPKQESQDLADTRKESPEWQGLANIAPPVSRFMEVSNAGDLKISEVAELLSEYRRLADALSILGAHT